MEYFPGEIYDLIVTHLHNHFCRSTRYLKSHGTFVLGSTCPHHSIIERQVRYCTDEDNRSIVAGIAGLRIDFDLLESRGEPQQISESTSRERAAAAQAARDRFQLALPSVVAPFDSVTALELRFATYQPSEHMVYRGVGRFIQNNLPRVKDLYLRGGQHAINRFLVTRPPHFRSQLRQLWVFYMTPVDRAPPIAQFKNLTELGVHYPIRSSLSLPPQLMGLTRLHLRRVTTTAAHLISMLTRGPTPPGAGHDHASTGRPLAKCIFLDMELDIIYDENGRHGAGTWAQVFRFLRDHCPKLTFLSLEWHGYGSEDHNHTPSKLQEYCQADNAKLMKLLDSIRPSRARMRCATSRTMRYMDGGLSYTFSMLFQDPAVKIPSDRNGMAHFIMYDPPLLHRMVQHVHNSRLDGERTMAVVNSPWMQRLRPA
ncbi:hypothetical protein C8A01DRAFT_41901 [Parachaetomium inaequale]|uniref:Uncharacterized protein n=1 Tax=Parachaetomium inaequale TaxID=2588326 RepID=A0AAN6SLM9_9PEZI|nr:hypothetical protein C8A01DRAFT_41901 [Parachaetomium inaequale]